MVDCLIGFGSNVGNGAALLVESLGHLACHGYVIIRAVSRPIQTAPVGGPEGQAEYLNAAIRLETSLEPDELLGFLQQVEHSLGRRRTTRWGPRTVDLDLLLYGGEVIDTEYLVVPHPRMAFRQFVLLPAAEIASEMTHPTTGWTIAALLKHLATAPQYVALMGPPGIGKHAVIRELVRTGRAAFLPGPSPPDPSSPRQDSLRSPLEMELDLLKSRARHLRRRIRPCEEVLVTDFWWEQSLAYARATLSREEARQFESQLFLERQRDIPRPSLAVAWIPGGCQGRLAREMTKISQTPGGGPWLLLRTSSPAEVVTEIGAAIEAMQPVNVLAWEGKG